MAPALGFLKASLLSGTSLVVMIATRKVADCPAWSGNQMVLLLAILIGQQWMDLTSVPMMVTLTETMVAPYFHRLLDLLMDEPMVVLMVEHLEQCLAPQKAL